MRGQHESEKKIQRMLKRGEIPRSRRGYHREIQTKHQQGCDIFRRRRCRCNAEIVVVWHPIPRDTYRTEERPPQSRAAVSMTIPPDIWRALSSLAHPDKWQEASSGMQQASHEAMVWLNTHKP